MCHREAAAANYNARVGGVSRRKTFIRTRRPIKIDFKNTFGRSRLMTKLRILFTIE